MSNPSTREELLSLAERVGKASGPDRELFEAAFDAINGMSWSAAAYRHGALGEEPSVEKGQAARRFGELVRMEAWLDAAMSLVPSDEWSAKLTFGPWNSGTATLWHAIDHPDDIVGSAATPALALTAASLRARAAEEASNGR